MKTVCIYHSIDLDGWMSAAIVKHWWTKNNPQGIFYNNPYKGDCSIISWKENETSLTMFGYNYGDEIPNLSKYDKVIMCDISFDTYSMIELDDKLIWIDHHISAIKSVDAAIDINKSLGASKLNGLQDTKFAACELSWMYFFPNEIMPEIVRLLGRYDCFGHKGTSEEQEVLEFQYGARVSISNYEEAHEHLVTVLDDGEYSKFSSRGSMVHSIFSRGSFIYKYLCTEAKQVYKNGFEIKLGFTEERIGVLPENYIGIDNYKTGNLNCANRILPITCGIRKNNTCVGCDSYNGVPTKYKFIAINRERFNPINFGIDYHKDGYDGCACFHYANENWNFSLYNDNGEVDCSVIAKQYGGGGHKGAAGFIIDNINKIIKC